MSISGGEHTGEILLKYKTMMLINIGFGLMTLAAVAGAVVIHRQRKHIREMSVNYTKAGMFRTAYELSRMSEARVEERTDGPLSYFAVCRDGLGEKIDVLCVAYDPDDPDDREYKRVFAEERAEMLNEKP